MSIAIQDVDFIAKINSKIKSYENFSKYLWAFEIIKLILKIVVIIALSRTTFFIPYVLLITIVGSLSAVKAFLKQMSVYRLVQRLANEAKIFQNGTEK